MSKMNLLKQRSSNRTGVLIFAVLACLIVVTIIFLGTLQVSIRYRRQMRDEMRVEQVRWLLDAATRNALQKLSDDPKFAGEEISIEQTPGVRDRLFIRTRVGLIDEDSSRRRLHVLALASSDPELEIADIATMRPRQSQPRRSILRRSVQIIVPVANNVAIKNAAAKQPDNVESATDDRGHP